VWQQPLMTVNGQQIINDILGVCGGRNVFAGWRRWCRSSRPKPSSTPTRRRS
jgi:hypothetical protein